MTTRLRLETLSAARNFNEAVFQKVAPFLGRRILEVGMGLGAFTGRLLERADSVVGLDPVPEFLAAARRRFAGEGRLETHAAAMGAGVPSVLAGRSFDTIVCLNVLEHIENDSSALSDFRSLLETGGRLVLVVPQYPWLFNGLDSSDGHFRRYRREELLEKIQEAGFTLEALRCFNMAGILGWFLNGTLLGREELPRGQLSLYDKAAPLLLSLESWIGPPAGLSLLAVGRRG